VVAVSYLVGSIPLSQIASRLLRGVDLKSVGTGTVSGTNLYEVTGFGPLAAVGCLEVVKGAVGPRLAGRGRPGLAAAAAGAAVVGHDWSPFLRFAGGRGISPAMGATLVVGPEGTALLAAGLGVGRLAGETALGCFAAIVALSPALAARRGKIGAAAGAALAAPQLLKRILGNGPPPPSHPPKVYLWRLLLDRDSPKAVPTRGRGG
jgi:glycerol-3-phosphate acyltransferase PlsY